MSDGSQPGQGILQDRADGQPSLQDFLGPLWAARKKILLIPIVVAVITLGINYLLPVYYRATATLLPETEKGKLSSLGQFAGVAQQFLSGNIPGSEIARLYPTVVNSETVLRSVIEKKYHTQKSADSIDLIQFFGLHEETHAQDMAKALKMLKDLLSTSQENRTSVVTLSLEMEEPQLVADVLNAVIAELDRFMRFKRFTNASEQVKWIDIRLNEVLRELRLAEEGLKDFREKNRRVNDSPELLLQQERLARDVQIKSTIVIELKKQYELAKLDEIKNLSIVNVLDPARPPVVKERPKRKTNAIIMGVLTSVALSGYYVCRALYADKVNMILRTLRNAKS